MMLVQMTHKIQFWITDASDFAIRLTEVINPVLA